MANKKLNLVNRSTESRVVMLSKKGTLTPQRLRALSSLPVTKSELSQQVEDMLKRPDLFGVHLEEEVEEAKTSKNKGDEEDG